MKLTVNEERAVFWHILKLGEQVGTLQLANITFMTNSLPAERCRDPVGPKWANAFVKRQPKLQVKLSRKYD
jgi:hypothetical protein